MNIITATEFRSNQRKYFELAEKEPVFVTRSGKSPLCISRVPLEMFPTKEELKAIKDGLAEYKASNTTVIEDIDNIWESIL